MLPIRTLPEISLYYCIHFFHWHFLRDSPAVLISNDSIHPGILHCLKTRKKRIEQIIKQKMKITVQVIFQRNRMKQFRHTLIKQVFQSLRHALRNPDAIFVLHSLFQSSSFSSFILKTITSESEQINRKRCCI